MKQIPLFKVFMSDRAIEAAEIVLRSGFVGQGPVTDQFETVLKKYFDSDYVLTTNSCTNGIHLALSLLKKPDVNSEVWPGIQEGDEVLSTPLTCWATNSPILNNGLNIKWVDINPNTLNMDLDDLERKISPRTKVIIPVFWAGMPCNLGRIKQIQQKSKELYGFSPAVIEDCAHAIGGKYAGKLIGTHGNISVFSLGAIKHITSVNGGIVVFPHQKLHNRGELQRWYGLNRKEFAETRCIQDIQENGGLYHMVDLNAAIGMANFDSLDFIVNSHKKNAQYYNENLQNIPGVTVLTEEPLAESSYWLYTILVENRNGFQQKMKELGIAANRVHERNDKYTCVKQFRQILPNMDKLQSKYVCIPVGIWVEKDDREYIVDCIKKGW